MQNSQSGGDVSPCNLSNKPLNSEKWSRPISDYELAENSRRFSLCAEVSIQHIVVSKKLLIESTYDCYNSPNVICEYENAFIELLRTTLI